MSNAASKAELNAVKGPKQRVIKKGLFAKECKFPPFCFDATKGESESSVFDDVRLRRRSACGRHGRGDGGAFD